MNEALAETEDAVQEDTPKVEEDGSGTIDATALLGDKRWSMLITSKAVEMGIINFTDSACSNCNFCEINKGLWFWHIWKFFFQPAKLFQEFELLPGVVAAVRSGMFFQNT